MTLIRRFRTWLEERRLRARVRALTPEERAGLLAAAPFELYSEQGMEGEVWILLRGAATLGDAIAGGIPGQFSPMVAEDLILMAMLQPPFEEATAPL